MRRSSRINQFMVRRSFFIFFLFLSLVLSFPLTSEARTIQFINNCSQTIWFAFTGGSVKIPCGAGCPAGTVCNPADKLCYWANPLPPGGDTAAAFSIAGSGGTKTVTIPDSNQVTIPGSTTPQVWSGLIAGRTGCQSIDSGSQLKCMTANCPGNSGLSGFPQTTHGCFVGRGPEDAFNAAELTFQPTAPDFYDVTLINGINVPLQMEPVAGVTDPGNPYTCGIAAGLTPLSGSLSSCTWDLKPPMNDFIFVSPGGAKCSTDAGCTAPDLCGSSFNPVANGFEKSCGKFLGYWTATTLCSTNSGKGAPAYLKCNNPLPAADYPGAGADTMTQLFKCETPNAAAALLNSCYSFNSASCCGCSKWGVSPGTTGIVAPTVLGAVCLGTTFATNFWVIGNSQLPSVLSQVAWLKRACPTSYAYQYDDKASTFQCPGTVSAPPANSQNYKITFCANGDLTPPSSALNKVAFSATTGIADTSATVNWTVQTIAPAATLDVLPLFEVNGGSVTVGPPVCSGLGTTTLTCQAVLTNLLTAGTFYTSSSNSVDSLGNKGFNQTTFSTTGGTPNPAAPSNLRLVYHLLPKGNTYYVTLSFTKPKGNTGALSYTITALKVRGIGGNPPDYTTPNPQNGNVLVTRMTQGIYIGSVANPLIVGSPAEQAYSVAVTAIDLSDGEASETVILNFPK